MSITCAHLVFFIVKLVYHSSCIDVPEVPSPTYHTCPPDVQCTLYIVHVCTLYAHIAYTLVMELMEISMITGSTTPGMLQYGRITSRYVAVCRVMTTEVWTASSGHCTEVDTFTEGTSPKRLENYLVY